MNRLRRLTVDECGATAIEYGLLAALLVIVVVASFSLLGDPVQGLLGGVASEFDTVNENL